MGTRFDGSGLAYARTPASKPAKRGLKLSSITPNLTRKRRGDAANQTEGPVKISMVAPTANPKPANAEAKLDARLSVPKFLQRKAKPAAAETPAAPQTQAPLP
ncbi:hypothetical protein P5P81_20650 [Tritonibacter mobilis]|nr:hypothetical protein [Tritonibacter mobilis]